jgi:hypothetical protein
LDEALDSVAKQNQNYVVGRSLTISLVVKNDGTISNIVIVKPKEV